MKTHLAALFLVLSQCHCQVSGFSTPAQLTLAPRVFSTGSIHQVQHLQRQNAIHSSSKLQMTNDAVLPPDVGSTEEEPIFEAVGKGIVRDYKARLPLMASDITDGLNTQVRYE
jgi:hypothetical protein